MTAVDLLVCIMYSMLNQKCVVKAPVWLSGQSYEQNYKVFFSKIFLDQFFIEIIQLQNILWLIQSTNWPFQVSFFFFFIKTNIRSFFKEQNISNVHYSCICLICGLLEIFFFSVNQHLVFRFALNKNKK